MLAKARRSACRPAPLVGSVSANVKTAGREGTDSFMGTRGAIGGLHLKPGSRCARQPGIATMLQGSARVHAFYSSAHAFAYVFTRARSTTLQNVALPCVRPDLRRGRRLARRRHSAWDPMGGHPDGLVLSRVRCP